ncbi:unnamed protein product [Pylaiella littoralis]
MTGLPAAPPAPLVPPAASFSAVVLFCCFGSIEGLLLGLSPQGWPGQQQLMPLQQQENRSVIVNSSSHCGSSRKLDLLALASASDSSSENSGYDSKPTGFGTRASRRGRKVKQGGSGKKRQGGLADAPVVVLKRSSRWACVKNCGACCYLAPDERPDLAEYLPDPKEYDLYMSMANDDGWCKHFDKENRACTIYTERPRFCRVETETFGSMYGVDPEDMDDFCSACCNEQITDVYGAQSKELRVFNEALAALERGERPKPELSAFGGDLRGAGEGQVRDWGLNDIATADLPDPLEE